MVAGQRSCLSLSSMETKPVIGKILSRRSMHSTVLFTSSPRQECFGHSRDYFPRASACGHKAATEASSFELLDG